MKDSERTAGLRRLHLSDAQRQAARIERCLHQKHSIHRAARAQQDSKPADARDPGVRASLHAAHPVAAPAAPLEVHLILSGEVPRKAFLLDGLLIGLEKPGGGVRPIVIS